MSGAVFQLRFAYKTGGKAEKNHGFIDLCSRYDFLVGFWHHSSLLLLSVVSLVDYFILMGSNPSVFVSQCRIYEVLLNLKITKVSDFFFLLVLCFSFICSVTKSCLTLCNPMDYSPPGSTVHGISQARILEWVAILFSRGSFQIRDQTHVSCIGLWILYHWATMEALYIFIFHTLDYPKLTLMCGVYFSLYSKLVS